MGPTQEQLQRLRQMSPENRQAFHLNRIATSLEEIQVLLRSMRIADLTEVYPDPNDGKGI